MKKLILLTFLLAIPFFGLSQESPKVGDELKINEPHGHAFTHVDFPQPNILKKKGVVTHYKSVRNNVVVVDEVVEKDNGETYVILRKKDDSKFFGYLNKVKANYQKSIETGELLKI